MKDGSTSNQRTSMRKSILFALERLLEQKEYVQIGISEICAEAHISKPTFYRYFQSKENIVLWLSEAAISCGVGEVGRKYTWFEGIFRTTVVLYRHKVFYSDPQSPTLTNSLISFSRELLKERLIETLTTYKGIELTDKLNFQVESLNYTLSYMSRQWGVEGMLTPPDVQAEYLVSIVPYDLYHLLNTPTDSIIRHDDYSANDID